MNSAGCTRPVMIVDDDEDIRELLKDFLEDHGFAVVAAADGREALGILEQSPPCFVLLDMMMPEMDGWELLQRLASNPPPVEIAIYISTSAPELAPAGYPMLPKPVNLTTVLEAIRRHCTS